LFLIPLAPVAVLCWFSADILLAGVAARATLVMERKLGLRSKLPQAERVEVEAVRYFQVVDGVPHASGSRATVMCGLIRFNGHVKLGSKL
jgi:hypothetical protein